MISFKIPKKDIKDIILTYSKQNNLPAHYEEQLVIMIESSEFVDYIEMAKKEKERIEFENEYNQIASAEKNYKGSFQEQIDKRRSKSGYVDSKGNKNAENKENGLVRNISDFDYEFIDKKDFVGTEFKKNRSQSFFESSNTNEVLREGNADCEENEKSKLFNLVFYTVDKESFFFIEINLLGEMKILEHYLNNDLRKIVEKEMHKADSENKKHNSSQNVIKVINEFYTSSDNLSKELNNINLQEEKETNENSDKNKYFNLSDNPEIIKLTNEDCDAELIVRKNSENKLHDENQEK